ncbi:acyltransferase family protein [Clostridium manihotivorum]|uniref:Acyltransferase 3 domain-containing protein n=1 Tax=Clostridium manihotivorum TaxID=2320868 RepID=A0A410DYD5_9CLOT|nr:acyltransferase [Clostridium manihotivorum]QAA34018.1 hypothetical protein C1I91_21665 [Clostridium manihotivorum]
MIYIVKRIFRISNNNIRELDGLRGIAVLMVFFYHIKSVLNIKELYIANFNIGPYLMWGHLGVNVFYILSGFLLFIPFAKAYYTNSSINLTEYSIKRALRILPAFYFFLIIFVFCVKPELITKQGIRSLIGNMLFLQKYSIFNIQSYNDTVWTLAVEVQFYILIPFVARFFVDNKYKKSILVSILFVLLYRLVIMWFLKPNMISINRDYYVDCEYNILGCFDNFAIGIVIANLYIQEKLGKQNINIKRVILISKKIAAFSPILILFLMNNYYNWNYNNSKFHNIFFSFFFDIVFYICIGSILILVLFSRSKLNSILSNFFLVFIGAISYSIYIWHLFFQARLVNISVIARSHSITTRYLILIAVSILFIIPFSTLMYILVERPFIDLSKRLFKIDKIYNNEVKSMQ